MKEEGGFFKPEIKEETKKIEDDEILLPLHKNDSCMYCESIPLSPEMMNVFKMKICNNCKYSKLKFITKTRSKEDFLLTEEELLEFKYLTRPNPHKGTWNDMQLFIEEEIENFSLKKYGSKESIEEIKKSREMNNKKIKMRRIKKKVQDMKKRTFLAPKKGKHEHLFVKKGKDSICECGLIVEQEEI